MSVSLYNKYIRCIPLCFFISSHGRERHGNLYYVIIMLIILTTIFLGFLKSNSFNQKKSLSNKSKIVELSLHQVLSRQIYFHHHALIFIEIFDFKVQPISQITLQQPIFMFEIKNIYQN